MSHRRGILYATCVFLIAGPTVLWFAACSPTAPEAEVVLPIQRSTADAAVSQPDLVEAAKRDPMVLVRRGREWYTQNVREYRCVLTKQESIDGKLSPIQEIELRYRERPRSVYMLWKRNAGAAKRALYMDKAAFVDDMGRRLARVEPAGAIARLFVKDILMPINGPEARKASRRTIDEAGFHATFELLEAYNEAAAARGVLDLRYGGTGVVDGRPTYVIIRDLPYDGAGGPYPDARMVMHLDQEWLVPVAVYSYADHEERELLGSYVFTKVEFNPDFGQDDFEF